MTSDYQSWLERQNELAQEALKLVQKFKFKAVVIRQENKPSFVRVYIKETKVDFLIKEVKSQFSRSVWLCKKEDFNPQNNYLVFQNKEERWVVSTGSQIEVRAELRDSDYHKGKKFVVVPMDTFRSAKTFFKRMRKRYEQQLQRRMNEWF